MKIETAFITLNDGTQICAPADIRLMSNFVLKEQGDWFEDEIHFVREFIQSDMQALDIGANYGLYTTAIASQLGEKGKLWCFEPTPNTADALRKTLKKNHYDDKTQVLQTGLSDHNGEASFFASPNAELNSLTESAGQAGEKITIELTTLDDCLKEHAWQTLDFIKLDAEGEESRILDAGKQTLSQCSPLIMFELKHLNQVNTPLIQQFKSLGYDTYRLVPGLNVLVPLDTNAQLDGFLLNLFCCKAETAQELSERGVIVMSTTPQQAVDTPEIKNLIPSTSKLALHPSDNEQYTQALTALACSKNKALSNEARYQHLLFAFEIVKQVLKQGENRIERLSTYARICFEFGERSIGIKICEYIIQRYMQQKHAFELAELFFPASESFDQIQPKGPEQTWILCSVLDVYIRKHAFSCYFTRGKTLPMMEQLKAAGYLSDEMERRMATLLALKSTEG